MTLICDTITVKRNERCLFEKLGFSLGEGSILVVKGGNGTGKTTLLKTLAGLIKPHTGTISYYGESITERFDEYASELHYIGHQIAVKPQLTVEENLLFWSKLRGSEMLIPAAIHYFQLEDAFQTPCYQLSAGWKQRVALARLLACPAKIWLLDEPTTHLDQAMLDQFANLISARANEGGIVIIASHMDLAVKNYLTLQLEDFIPNGVEDEKA